MQKTSLKVVWKIQTFLYCYLDIYVITFENSDCTAFGRWMSRAKGVRTEDSPIDAFLTFRTCSAGVIGEIRRSFSRSCRSCANRKITLIYRSKKAARKRREAVEALYRGNGIKNNVYIIHLCTYIQRRYDLPECRDIRVRICRLYARLK